MKRLFKRSGAELNRGVEKIGEEFLEFRKTHGKTLIVILNDWDQAYDLAKTICEEVVDTYGITPVVRYGKIGVQRFIPYMFRKRDRWYVRVDFAKKIQDKWSGIRRYEIIEAVYADYEDKVWLGDFYKKIVREIC